nr:tetratricopeptide repeat protein [uncultured Flavobacterium sp.]
MTVNDYTYLINKPDTITEIQADALGTVLNEFPYFQSARALRLKGLYNQKSFKYNYALKVTAAHTTDRAVLFDFITSESFAAIQKDYYDKKLKALLNITVFDSTIISPEEIKEVTEVRIDPIEQSILTSIKEANNTIFEEIADPVSEEPLNSTGETTPEEVKPEEIEEIEETKAIEESVKIAEEHLEIGKPLDFTVNEKHSFQEWLQLSRTQPIDRTKETSIKQEAAIKQIILPAAIPDIEKIAKQIADPEILDEEKKKKAEIINKFIETNPKISPIKSGSPTVPIQFDINKDDNSYLMTETLARVYLEQKKYTKAIQAYQILILKYPEKISFFADRIADIKILQQNNNNN